MAKKSKKSTKKGPAMKRPVSDKTLEAIMVECAIAVGQGVGTNHEVSEAARKSWHGGFRKSIKKALASGLSWKVGRKTVVPLATKMGGRAAQLASSKVIGKPEADQAATEIKADPACPAGMGKFCS